MTRGAPEAGSHQALSLYGDEAPAGGGDPCWPRSAPLPGPRSAHLLGSPAAAGHGQVSQVGGRSLERSGDHQPDTG